MGIIRLDGQADAEGDDLCRVRVKANAMLNTLFEVIVPFRAVGDEIGVYVTAENARRRCRATAGA